MNSSNTTRYVLFNKENNTYLDDSEYETMIFSNAWLYESFKDATESLEEMDDPREWEIQEYEVTYTFVKTYKRKIIFE